MRRTIRWGTVVALLLLAPACGDDSDSSDDAGGSDETTEAGSDTGDGGDACAASDEGEAVTAVDFAFDPVDVVVASGGVVTVTNDDGATHTFTSGDAGFDCEVPSGEAINVVVDAAAGEYEFHCDIHPAMTGTITVQ